MIFTFLLHDFIFLATITIIVLYNQDNEGQSPLHYAAVCEREKIGEFLVKHKADKELMDNDGNSAFDLCDLKWPWLKNAVA